MEDINNIQQISIGDILESTHRKYERLGNLSPIETCQYKVAEINRCSFWIYPTTNEQQPMPHKVKHRKELGFIKINCFENEITSKYNFKKI